MLHAYQLSYSHNGIHSVFQSLDLHFSKQRCGVVGPNGAGKSTLLQVLAGQLKPLTGHVERSEPSLWLPQLKTDTQGTWADILGPDLNPIVQAWWASERGDAKKQDLELLQDLWPQLAGWSEWSDRWQVSETPWLLDPKHLSGGELQRLRLALSAILPRSIWLLDEPSLHLDQKGRALLGEALTAFDGLLILASHDRELLRAVDSILYLEQGKARLYSGGFASVEEQRAKEEALLLGRIQAAEDTLQKLKEHAQLVKQRQQKRSDRAKKKAPKMGLPQIVIGGLKRKAEESSGRLKIGQEKLIADQQNQVIAQKALLVKKVDLHFDLHHDDSRSQKRLLRIQNFHAVVAGQSLWKKPLNFELKTGARCWLRGSNGSGKSTLLRSIMGELESPKGEVEIFARHPIYLDQKLAMLDPEATLTLIWQDPAFIADEGQRRTIAARLGLTADFMDRPFRSLSGGERMRAALVMISTRKTAPDLILLDEPTNHLDLATQSALLDTLQQLEAALLVVSHEPDFVELLQLDSILDLDELRF